MLRAEPVVVDRAVPVPTDDTVSCGADTISCGADTMPCDANAGLCDADNALAAAAMAELDDACKPVVLGVKPTWYQ